MTSLQPVTQWRLCASCDARNAPDAAFCEDCGAPFSQPQPEAAPARQLPPAAPRPRLPPCGACGIVNPTGAVFCVNCGTSLAGSPETAQPPAPQRYAPGAVAQGGTVVQHIYMSAPPTPASVPLVARALWFLFIGLWAGQVWLVIAWLFNLTLIGLPLGLWMLSAMPQVMTLAPQRQSLHMPPDTSGASFAVRAVYFILIGWWASFLWLQLAWVLAATVIGLPVAFMMFERVNTVMTLADR